MGWKRRRDRWRKLPQPKDHGPSFGVHWGRYQKIPKVPGGPELSFSTSGAVEESRPWSLWKWVGVVAVGAVVFAIAWPFLFVGPFWIALAIVLMVLIYRTWRR